MVRIGSKTFTESVILGEMAAGLVQQAGAQPEHRQGLGGTRILWDALRGGAIDLYPEYTGTLRKEILARQKIDNDADLRQVLADPRAEDDTPGVQQQLCHRYEKGSLPKIGPLPDL